MKRALGLVGSFSFVLVLGCAAKYDFRLEKTIEHRKYQRKLDNNLAGPPTKSKLQDINVFLRPPKGLQGPAQTFAIVVEPGKYDVENSFIDAKRGDSLHVLARVKAQKPAAAKKGAAPPPAETVPRGDFKADVLDVLRSVYSVEIATTQLKDSTKKGETGRANVYKAPLKALEADQKELQVYFYGDKNSPAEVALIFEYPKAERDYMSQKIALCLETFAVGDIAKRLYTNTDEQAAEEGAAPAGVAF